MRGKLEVARRTGDYDPFLTAIAELRRFAETGEAGEVPGADPDAGVEARALFMELRGVVYRSVRADGRRRHPGDCA